MILSFFGNNKNHLDDRRNKGTLSRQIETNTGSCKDMVNLLPLLIISENSLKPSGVIPFDTEVKTLLIL